MHNEKQYHPRLRILLKCLSGAAAFCLLLAAMTLAVPHYAGAEERISVSAPSSAEKDQGGVDTSVDISCITTDSGKTYFLLPPGDLYPFYLADPHRVGMGIQFRQYVSSEIPDAGKSRFYLKTGGSIGIIRVQPPEPGALRWQFNLEGGFDGQFDINNSLDNIGWDGNYGLSLSLKPDSPLAFRASMIHTSSHVGDEYIARTGRARIGYTRHEFIGGMTWFMNDQLRSYYELGWGFDLGNKDLMEPGRLQGGIEFEDDVRVLGNIFRWYAAGDVSAWEERGWRIDVSVQAGVMVRSAGRRFRLGLEYYDGRVPIGEFFQYDESSISLGAWVDL